MDGTSHDDSARNGYDENESSGGDDTTRKLRTRSANRRRRTSATITNVRIARIETVAMTAEEETEAIQALAVLVARYWREHPHQAA
jgi:hypothetical protein